MAPNIVDRILVHVASVVALDGGCTRPYCRRPSLQLSARLTLRAGCNVNGCSRLMVLSRRGEGQHTDEGRACCVCRRS